jgi:hypothetical protein
LRGYSTDKKRVTALQIPGSNRAAIVVGADATVTNNNDDPTTWWSNTAPFCVLHDGTMTAKKGHVGGWLIEDDCLIGRSPSATGEWGDYERVTAF